MAKKTKLPPSIPAIRERLEELVAGLKKDEGYTLNDIVDEWKLSKEGIRSAAKRMGAIEVRGGGGHKQISYIVNPKHHG